MIPKWIIIRTRLTPLSRACSKSIKKITKLVELKKVDCDLLVQSGQIKLQQAKLIPTLKTGDELKWL